jgi:NarL family two-component system response regulator LiaR
MEPTGPMSTGEPVRVLVVDDHRMFAEALEFLLAGEEGMRIIASVGSGEEALDLARREPLDVALVDIDLPGIDGIELTRELRNLSSRTQVVIITAFQERDVMVRAMEAGACGFVPKTQAADGLIEIIRRAAAGEIVLPSGDIGALLRRLEWTGKPRSDAERLASLLTTREVQILQAIAQAKQTGEIARELSISPQTVQTHVKNILAKLGVHSKLEALTFGVREGLVRLEPGTWRR